MYRNLLALLPVGKIQLQVGVTGYVYGGALMFIALDLRTCSNGLSELHLLEVKFNLRSLRFIIPFLLVMLPL